MTRFPGTCSILLAVAILLAAVPACIGQEARPADAGRQALPSLVTISVQRTGGVVATGAAFLAVKDGLLVTALHVLRDATRVTATFPNGEEFDCPGLVDKDERHNLALVKIKAFGRPALDVGTAELAAGSQVFCPVVKDGAFGVVETSVTDVVIRAGIKFYHLAGELPQGNNGSPLVDARGRAVGMHVTITEDGKDIEMALPSAYILGLEPSLPVQPWAQAAAPPTSGNPAAAAGGPAAAQGQSAGIPANDAVDTGLAAAMLQVHDMWVSYGWLSQSIYQMTRYSTLRGIDFYKVQSDLDGAISQVGWLKPGDPLREKLAQAAAQLLAREKEAIEFDTTCWLLNKDEHPGKHVPAAEDAGRRAGALFGAIPNQVLSLRADFRRLAEASPVFLKALPSETRYFLGLADRTSKVVLGVLADPRTPMFLRGVESRSLADMLGLRGGDTIQSADGRTFKPEDDIEQFATTIGDHPGSVLAVVVQRNGKPKTLQMKIPADVLQKYARALQASSQQ